MRAIAFVAALLLAVPVALAAVTSQADTTDSSKQGELVTLTYTKASSSAVDGAQVGNVTVLISGPEIKTLAAKAYNFQATLFLQDAQTLTWAWTPTKPGTYTVFFDDAPATGPERDVTKTHVVSPNGAKWAVEFGVCDPEGELVQRAWGDFTPTANSKDLAAENFLCIHNPGRTSKTVVVKFLDSSFRNGLSVIPLYGNIAFRVGVGHDAPTDMLQGPTSQDGHLVLGIPPQQTAWVDYVVKDTPPLLVNGDYQAPYTVITY